MHRLRQATFRGPSGVLKDIMTNIYNTSKERKNQLENLWAEPYYPIIGISHAPKSMIGDAIQSDVERSATFEMLSPFLSIKASSSWDVRFILLQAQATRMISAVATSIRKFERNGERRKWLEELAMEYENMREDLIRKSLFCIS